LRVNGTSWLLLVFTLILLAAGLALLWWAGRARRRSGLPTGAVVYSDTGAEKAVLEPLVSRRYGLVGKPDYLVEVGQGQRRTVVPLEVKSRKQPPVLHEGHGLQLATYCLLVEDVYGVRPPLGYLRYADATLAVPFTDELRGAVLQAAASIRKARTQTNVRRSHQEAGRCARCGYLASCGAEALAAIPATPPAAAQGRPQGRPQGKQR
jgi:CRISPR-associated exonuclease Cas4